MKKQTLTAIAPVYIPGMVLLESIKITKTPDDNPDLDYLDQFANSENPDEIKYYEQDQQRKNNYGITWNEYGFHAVANILIPSEDQKSYQDVKISSGGLWGIESDSSNEYFKEVAEDQLSELAYNLQKLGIWVLGGVKLFEGSKSEKTLQSFDLLAAIAINNI